MDDNLFERLTHLKVRLAVSRKVTEDTEEEWEQHAIDCRYCQDGGDGLECAYMGQEEGMPTSPDPFCYSENCPFIKEVPA